MLFNNGSASPRMKPDVGKIFGDKSTRIETRIAEKIEAILFFSIVTYMI
jgi:hypothetical protein